jgi:hypothetical protein
MGKPQSETDEELANRYRASWRSATDTQRDTLCKQLGLKYTSVSDETLLRQVATKQHQRWGMRKQASREGRKELLKGAKGAK